MQIQRLLPMRNFLVGVSSDDMPFRSHSLRKTLNYCKEKNVKKRVLSHITLPLVLISFTWGCNQNDQKNIASDASKLAATAGTAMQNSELAGKVKLLVSNWKGVESTINVQAENGVVTLEGDVKSREEKRKILSIVNQIRGVDKVVDRLKGKDEGR